ncbi:MAG TPA: transporter substrate-binding domain-containing protein [Candidatus Thermoplasmatota archaeon]|nr:transporter substrate-binding domain-containing protein [Candidatus Thermoplasmatota archaeon]
MRAALVAIAVVAVLAAPAQAGRHDPLTPEERAWVEAHGAIRHAPDPNFPPFESLDASGRLVGINGDILDRISRNLGIRFETVPVPDWDAALLGLRNGTVDLLGALAVTAERDTWMDFTRPYTVYGEVFYITDPALQDVQDLVGKRVGIVQNYAAGVWLRENHPELTTVEVPDTLSGLNMLSRGELDAFFENIPVAGYYIQATSLHGIRVMGDPLYYSPASWGVRQGETVLLSIMEKGLASISPGEMSRVFEYWTGSDISVRPPRPDGLLPWQRNVLLGISGVTLASVAWNASMRRTVQRRTEELAESQRQLAALNADLEGRIERRTRQLEAANRDLEAFARTVSHDLRTPLSVVTLQADALRRRAAGDEDLQRRVERIRSNAQRMGRLLEDLLRLAQAASLPLRRERLDLTAMVWEAVHAQQDAEPARKVDVDVQPGMSVAADPQLLRIVLGNLLANAWKFTRETAAPRVRVRMEGAVVVVEDNGAGFDPAQKDRLFQPFQRLHDQARFEGTGIGLSTVARIVERHGGSITADGRPGEGATVRFSLGDPSPPASRGPSGHAAA